MSRLLSLVAAVALSISTGLAQDPTGDNSTIASASADLEYLTELFAFKGRPHNLDEERPVTILINHAYMVGFSPARKQPIWAAYRVSDAQDEAQYQRPPFFYDDLRLEEEDRISTDTFGGGFDRGHMVPNFAINKQYGKLAQLETFLMSNVCPQKAGLNRGPWMRLEHAIVEEYAPAWEHIWVIVGPIFPDQPETLARPGGIQVDVPSHFYVILVDVHGRQNQSTDILALKLPQDMGQGEDVTSSHLVSVNALEAETQLNFFPQFTTSQQNRLETDPAEGIWEVSEDD